MYKLLLPWRYLRTRWIALASIISVTLGVATMIIVNSVMEGFTQEMHQRLHGILSDVVIESVSLSGIVDPDWHVHEIESTLGKDVEGVTCAVRVPAMINVQVRGQWITQQVMLIGIDDASYATVSDFSKYLKHPSNRERLDFGLREDSYDAPLPESGWRHRKLKAAYQQAYREQVEQVNEQRAAAAHEQEPGSGDPFQKHVAGPPENLFDEAKDQHTGIVLGIAIASVRRRGVDGKVQDHFLCRPGDDVQITFPTTGQPPKAVTDKFTVVDLYESKMSEYDSTFAFVPLSRLQELRGMIDPTSGVASVTSIQLRLRPGANLTAARDKLRARFPVEEFSYRIETWRDMQGPLLAAVQMETTLLNILLFLIIAVAGFGILATFFMIVVEKTRDIGVLKSLGAPSSGVASIFLNYGLSLGIVGSGVGVVLGLIFVANINRIAAALEYITGREVFDPTIYYFQQIPTIVQPWTVAWVSIGSVLIAVLASVLPALRAARLHPVEALRYE